MMRPQAADRYRSQNSARRIVIISRDNTRTYTFSPLALFGGLTLFLTVSLGFLAATTYLVFRDDLFDLVRERNADMQQAYEDRIARLRSEIDRISSRQILDSVAMDEKVEKILSAQQGIAARQQAVGALIDKARSIGLIDGRNAPVGADKRAALDPDVTGSINAYAADAGHAARIDHQFDALTAVASATPAAGLRTSDGKPDLKAIASHLAAVDAEQAKAVEAIADAANSRVDAAVDVIANVGLSVDVPEAPADAEDAVGGPFIPLGSAQALAAAMQEADQAFERIERVKAEAAQLPLIRPLPGADKRAALDPDVTGSINAYAADTGAAARIDHQFDALTAVASSVPAAGLRTSDGKPDLKAIAGHLAAVDAEQAKAVEAIADAANSRADAAVDVIANVGLSVDVPEAPADAEDAVGGPFIPLGSAQALAAAMQEADQAFERIERVKAEAARLPLVRPLPGADMTSNFGSRRDPFLGSLAFHAGIDFRSPTGSDIRPTAPGVVTAAGWSGGYGNMVEVDHGNGITTRYGHMSRIIARVGDKVTRDTIIGEVGSTGRSTGPHLHYETRLNGASLNPINYIAAGSRLASLLP